jgi:hypothetical protein
MRRTKKCDDALHNAMHSVPQTVGGFRALLQWMRPPGCVFEEHLVEAFIASALASPVLAEEV